VKSFNELIESVRQQPKKRLAVAAAHSESVLEAVRDAREHDVADSLLVGRRDKILATAEKVGLDVGEEQILDAETDVEAARCAAFAVRSDQADILMKGHLHTDDFLRGDEGKDNYECGLPRARLRHQTAPSGGACRR